MGIFFNHVIASLYSGRLEVPSFKLMGIIVVISLGVMLTGIVYYSRLV